MSETLTLTLMPVLRIPSVVLIFPQVNSGRSLAAMRGVPSSCTCQRSPCVRRPSFKESRHPF